MSSVTESAKSQLIQLVDTPFTAQYSSFGTAQVNWGGTIGPIVSVSGYRQAYVFVVGTSITKSFDFNMGKISGATAAQSVNQPADGKMRSGLA